MDLIISDKLHDLSMMSCVSSHFKTQHPIEYEELLHLTNFLPDNASIRQRLWHIQTNTWSIPLCHYCMMNYVKWNRPYSKFCSNHCAGLSSDTKSKTKKANLEKYGVEYISQSTDIKDKIKQTNLEKYGVEYVLQSTNIKDKIKQTNLEKYGVENPFQADDIKDKIKQTNLEKYGVENPSQNINIMTKIQETNLTRYGNICSLQSNDIQSKIKTDNLIRHGVEYTFQRNDVKGKIYKTNIHKYGYAYIHQRHIPPHILTCLNDYEYMYNIHVNNKRFVFDIANDMGVTPRTIYLYLQKHNIPLQRSSKSITEQKIAEYINSIGDYDCISNTYKIISNKELDIYLPSLQIAFEFNGIYWHSELAGKNKWYHLNKTKMCEEQGIRLIHINEDEWELMQPIVKSRICNILGKSDKIYARKTQIIELTTQQTNEFLNETHIQGTCSSSVKFGLMYDGILVACMTFGKSRFDKNVEWELLRYSNKLNTSVVGGASKLFSYFIKKYNPKSVISYSDKRWNTGKLYENLGFKYSHTSDPNYKYITSGYKLESRQKYQKHKLCDILDIFNPQLTEWENMQLNGYNRIWDCGNDVFIWRI